MHAVHSQRRRAHPPRTRATCCRCCCHCFCCKCCRRGGCCCSSGSGGGGDSSSTKTTHRRWQGLWRRRDTDRDQQLATKLYGQPRGAAEAILSGQHQQLNHNQSQQHAGIGHGTGGTRSGCDLQGRRRRRRSPLRGGSGARRSRPSSCTNAIVAARPRAIHRCATIATGPQLEEEDARCRWHHRGRGSPQQDGVGRLGRVAVVHFPHGVGGGSTATMSINVGVPVFVAPHCPAGITTAPSPPAARACRNTALSARTDACAHPL